MQHAAKLGEIARGQQRQVTVDDLQRLGAKGRIGRQRLELQPEAFGGIARAHAGRLEALQVLEPDHELFGLERVVLGKELGDLVERRGEVAVVVERVDQRGDDLAIAQRQVEQRKLLHQVIAQRAGGDLLRREVVVLVRSAAAPVAVGARRRRSRRSR